MINIMNFEKPCSGAKTLRWEHSKCDIENVFENLGIRNYSMDRFQKKRF
jgi:hypothetical protein